MNDNDLRNNNDNNVYRATTNLNTAIENPDVNINSATGVNMVGANYYDNIVNNSNLGIDDSNTSNVNDVNVYNQDFNTNTNVNLNDNQNVVNDNINSNVGGITGNQFIPNADGSFNQVPIDVGNNIDNGNDNLAYQVDENVKYEPTMQTKKKPKRVSVLPKEVKAMIIIIFILLIVVYVIPYIYDFFREMDLIITNR